MAEGGHADSCCETVEKLVVGTVFVVEPIADRCQCWRVVARSFDIDHPAVAPLLAVVAECVPVH